MTTATLPLRPTFSDRLRLRPGLLATGLALGLAFELLVNGARFGLGHALFALLVGAAVVAHGGREAWQSAGPHRWLLGAAVLLAASPLLHDSVWLGVMNSLAAVVLGAVAVQGWTGERRLAALGPGQLLGAPFVAGGQALLAGATVAGRELERAQVGAAARRWAPPALRLLAIVGPPVLVVTGLLASGDAVFRERLTGVLDALFGVELGQTIRGGFVTAVSGVVLTGVLALAARRPHHASLVVPRRRLAAFETFALLGTLTVVLLAFGLTATPCALAPATCELPRGVTYAEAAHDGFFQLLFAGAVLLMVLMALPARTRLESRRAALGYAALATSLVVASMPMVVSGAARLWRYQEAYGLTTLRLLAWAGLVLVAAALAWRAVTTWAWQEAFVPGALGLLVATLLGLAVVGPDRVIARHNLAMPTTDLAYLASLSEDVVPELAQTFALRDRDDAQELEQLLFLASTRLSDGERALEWNLGRARAREAVTSSPLPRAALAPSQNAAPSR
jgi:hypothetical protein